MASLVATACAGSLSLSTLVCRSDSMRDFSCSISCFDACSWFWTMEMDRAWSTSMALICSYEDRPMNETIAARESGVTLNAADSVSFCKVTSFIMS